MVVSKWVEPVFVTPNDFSHWFGYYNYSPLDKANKRMLAHRVDFDGREITPNDSADVGWFDLKNGSWHFIGRTKAFNWQQGSMLQWLGPDYSERLIYNDDENGNFVSKIVSLVGEEFHNQIIQWPVYGLTTDGSKSISLEFKRSYWCRAYHYETIRDPQWNVPIAENDGIFSIDLLTGKVVSIINISEIVNYDKIPAFDLGSHWLEHIMLNPSGTRFAFYHRYTEKNGHRTRLFTADLNGENLYLEPGWQENEVSHLGWKSNIEYVVFKYGRARAGKVFDSFTRNSLGGELLRRYYHRYFAQHIGQKVRSTVISQNRYELRRDLDKQFKAVLDIDELMFDGHPSFTKDGRYMLTDTYADKEGFRHLLLYSILSKRVLELGRFYSPFNGGSYRCDLHPRFNHDDSLVVVDSAHSGRHQMVVLRLEWMNIIDHLD